MVAILQPAPSYVLAGHTDRSGATAAYYADQTMPRYLRTRPISRLLTLLLGCVLLIGVGWTGPTTSSSLSSPSSPRAAAADAKDMVPANDGDGSGDGKRGADQAPTSPTQDSDETPAPLPTENPFSSAVGGAELERSGTLVDPSGDTPELPTLSTQSFLVADLDSGDILAAQDPHGRRAPARALLPLTGLTLLPRLDPRAEYTIQPADTAVGGNRIGVRAGDVYTVHQLFYPLFMRGSQDAKSALVNAAGGAAATRKLMTQETRRLGAFDTQPQNPRALGGGAATSAYDLGLFTRSLFESDQVRRYLGSSDVSISPQNRAGSLDVHNADDLGPRLSEATGVNIDASGPSSTLSMGMAERDRRQLLVVVVGADAPAAESASELLEWGFDAADQVEPVGQLVTPDQVQRAETDRIAAAAESEQSQQKPTEVEPTVKDAADDPAGAASRALLSGPLLPLWLWLVAVVFIVMASLRVRAVMRDRRDNGSAKTPSGSSDPHPS